MVSFTTHSKGQNFPLFCLSALRPIFSLFYESIITLNWILLNFVLTLFGFNLFNSIILLIFEGYD